MTQTQTDRSKYVTDQVALWITNDGQWYENAKCVAETTLSMELFAEFLTGVLHRAPRYSAPWHVAQELAPNDYGRIHWTYVAAELLGE